MAIHREEIEKWFKETLKLKEINARKGKKNCSACALELHNRIVADKVISNKSVSTRDPRVRLDVEYLDQRITSVSSVDHRLTDHFYRPKNNPFTLYVDLDNEHEYYTEEEDGTAKEAVKFITFDCESEGINELYKTLKAQPRDTQGACFGLLSFSLQEQGHFTIDGGLIEGHLINYFIIGDEMFFLDAQSGEIQSELDLSPYQKQIAYVQAHHRPKYLPPQQRISGELSIKQEAEFVPEILSASSNRPLVDNAPGRYEEDAEKVLAKGASITLIAKIAARKGYIDYAEKLRERYKKQNDEDAINLSLCSFIGDRAVKEAIEKSYLLFVDNLAISAIEGGHTGYADSLHHRHGVNINLLAQAAAKTGNEAYAKELYKRGATLDSIFRGDVPTDYVKNLFKDFINGQQDYLVKDKNGKPTDDDPRNKILGEGRKELEAIIVNSAFDTDRIDILKMLMTERLISIDSIIMCAEVPRHDRQVVNFCAQYNTERLNPQGQTALAAAKDRITRASQIDILKSFQSKIRDRAGFNPASPSPSFFGVPLSDINSRMADMFGSGPENASSSFFSRLLEILRSSTSDARSSTVSSSSISGARSSTVSSSSISGARSGIVNSSSISGARSSTVSSSSISGAHSSIVNSSSISGARSGTVNSSSISGARSGTVNSSSISGARSSIVNSSSISGARSGTVNSSSIFGAPSSTVNSSSISGARSGTVSSSSISGAPSSTVSSSSISGARSGTVSSSSISGARSSTVSSSSISGAPSSTVSSSSISGARSSTVSSSSISGARSGTVNSSSISGAHSSIVRSYSIFGTPSSTVSSSSISGAPSSTVSSNPLPITGVKRSLEAIQGEGGLRKRPNSKNTQDNSTPLNGVVFRK